MDVPTDQRILETARMLVQTKGFNGFSYADLSAALGITKASIHYHFPTKAALTLEVVRQYRRLFRAGIVRAEAQTQDVRALLNAFFAFHQGLAQQDRLCVCLMLASETDSLEPEINAEVQAYFAESLDWLSSVLETGRGSGRFVFVGEASGLAMQIQAAVEGALVLSRAAKQPDRVRVVCEGVMASISS
jgi:TetR/AcrR family transcriptional regulator, transcriptional repressor for nem operon